MKDDRTYWFRARRFGIGSTPDSWQGVVATLVYVGAVLLATQLPSFPAQLAFIVSASIPFIWICCVKTDWSAATHAQARFGMGIRRVPVMCVLAIAVALLVIGCFMDPTPAVLIFGPILLPVVTAFGMDPIHFGIFIVFALSIGTITPPVGPVLFVGARVAGMRIEDVVRRLVPYFIALVALLVVVAFTPQLSLWLPGVLGLN